MRYQILVAAAAVAMWGAVGWAQAPRPQPGLKWSEAELQQAALYVRAGRVLTPESWPGGARVAVCLSFDPDNFSSSLNRGRTGPVTISRGEYGALTGLPRVLNLYEKYDIPGSFYIPAVAAMMHPEMIEQILARDQEHEVAVHGWIHENPLQLNDRDEERRLMHQAIDYLEEMSGTRPTGNRNPSWTFSLYTMELIKEAGFLYDSSLQAMDEPYEVLINGEPSGIVELPVNWVIDDSPVLGNGGSLASPRLALQTFKDDFDLAYQDGSVFMHTMHPHISGVRGRLWYLEELIKYIKSKPGVWFATGDQIARHIRNEFGMN